MSKCITGFLNRKNIITNHQPQNSFWFEALVSCMFEKYNNHILKMG